MPRLLLTLMFCAALLMGSASAQIGNAEISTTIDGFVETLYPKGSHYFWVVNDATNEVQHEIIVDINTTLRTNKEEEFSEKRFLLLLVNGQLFAAQSIPLEAKVKCHKEEEV